MGSMAAFVFAAQMVNFPLVGAPGLGAPAGAGVLAAVLLGPWAGAAVIAAVLLVQCFLYQDGGLTALGANFVNMGLIGSVGGYAIYLPIRRAIGGHRGDLDRGDGGELVLGDPGVGGCSPSSWLARGGGRSSTSWAGWP